MLTADAAAALLGITPALLCDWEQRFGYPKATRADGGVPLYPEDVVLGLRDALRRELSIARALTEARRGRDAERTKLFARASRGSQVIELPARSSPGQP